MPRLSANLTTMFQEWDLPDRFAAAADVGFEAVEIQFPYGHDVDVLAQRRAAAGVVVDMINSPPGDRAAGDFGLAGLPARAGEFDRSLELAVLYAQGLGARAIHVMAGKGADADIGHFETVVGAAADRLATVGLTCLIEPINRRSTPGYLLASFDAAQAIIARQARSNLRLQYDLFHRQILAGDVITSLAELMGIIGHVQIAGAPHRHEPDEGELAVGPVFATLYRLGYTGYVGCEYVPRQGTRAGLGWARPWLAGAAVRSGMTT